jgi:uncharacterized protein YjbI with pentapeptide repeats
MRFTGGRYGNNNLLRVKDKEVCNMIQIRHKSTGKVIKEVDATSLVNADLEGAYLWGANLRFANLQYANLQGADLLDADLQCAALQNADLRDANLQGANLWNADLRYANLKDTNLQDTNLRWVLGDGKRIKTTIDRYRIVIMQEYGVMAIGCKQYSIDEWMNFSDEEINKMDTDALHWWKEGKPRIQQLIGG